MKEITQIESILVQATVMTDFLRRLSDGNFLDSNCFENLYPNDDIYKEVLTRFGIGNPAVMQMMFYALLVMPKELLDKEDYSNLEENIKQINATISSLVEKEETTSSYTNEDSLEKINYFRHIRNAVSHSRYYYNSKDNKNYVTFEDVNVKDKTKTKTCLIKIECCKAGLVLTKLQELIIGVLCEKQDNK